MFTNSRVRGVAVCYYQMQINTIEENAACNTKFD